MDKLERRVQNLSKKDLEDCHRASISLKIKEKQELSASTVAFFACLTEQSADKWGNVERGSRGGEWDGFL